MTAGYISKRAKAAREAALEEMRERYRRRHKPRPTKRKLKKEKRKWHTKAASKRGRKRREITLKAMALACSLSAKDARSLRRRQALYEAANYFRELSGEPEFAEGVNDPPLWKRVSENVFAVHSEALKMTPRNLQVAVAELPDFIQKQFTSYRWKRMYRDSDKNRWMEFEGSVDQPST